MIIVNVVFGYKNPSIYLSTVSTLAYVNDLLS